MFRICIAFYIIKVFCLTLLVSEGTILENMELITERNRSTVAELS